MNLEEFRKALSSDATEDNIRLKKQLENTKVIYSKTHDVSDICKKYGGGGHAKAAGFTCEALPF